jgi:hypothetical protein
MTKVVQRLEEAGYEVALEGDNIRCAWRQSTPPDPTVVGPLLEELKRCKAEVVGALKESRPDLFDPRRQPPEGLFFAMEDPDKTGHSVAWRTGKINFLGYGETELLAVKDLERRETGARSRSAG